MTGREDEAGATPSGPPPPKCARRSQAAFYWFAAWVLMQAGLVAMDIARQRLDSGGGLRMNPTALGLAVCTVIYAFILIRLLLGKGLVIALLLAGPSLLGCLFGTYHWIGGAFGARREPPTFLLVAGCLVTVATCWVLVRAIRHSDHPPNSKRH